jgi:uracil-DNA glycosylase family 4
MASRREIRDVVRQHLETEMLLGASEVPLPPTEAVVENASAATGEKRPVVSQDELARRAAALTQIDEQHVRNCVKCQLSRTRTRTVFGQGNPAARVVFVGEAPGFEEDQQGLAFVGRAGQLLTAMIKAMGLTRDDVYICNVLKCRPPDNRTPAHDEIAACSPYLFEQLRILEPEVIVALGAPAAQTLLNTTESIGRLRGRFHDFYTSGTPMVGEPTPLMPTYHPAYLLRSPGEKRKAWEDLMKVMEFLGLPIPEQYR